MLDRWVEISVDKFIDDFIPGPTPTAEQAAAFGKFTPGPFDSIKEVEMYPEFCGVAQSVLDHCPNILLAKNTDICADVTEKTQGSKNLPGVILFSATGAAKKSCDLTDKKQMNQHTGGEPQHTMKTPWARISCLVELMSTKNEKISFQFPSESTQLLEDGYLAAEGRGQITEHVANILRWQPRLFCFMIFIVGRRARFLRWDRVGAVVSESFEFVGDSSTMTTFLYRYGHMDCMQRGHDPTAVLASMMEVTEMRNCRDTLSGYHKGCLDDAMEEGWPIYKILILPDDTIKSDDLTPEASNSQASKPTTDFGNIVTGRGPSLKRYFLIGKPKIASSSPTGRATRGYVAYDTQTKRLVFLKDTWRSASSSVRTEKEVILHLRKSGVRHIAALLSGGDVYSDETTVQKTLTQDYLGFGQSVARIHYRLISKDVYRPLESYEDSGQMMTVLLDALIAHEDAWVKAGVLHRDISVGNIMIDDTYIAANGKKRVRGILNDWDLCKFKNELTKDRQRTRAGTWQFMSALLLKYPHKMHDISDDLESFVHLSNWLVLKWHVHALSSAPAQLQNYVFTTYDYCSTSPCGLDVGGSTKYIHMRSGAIPFGPIQSGPLQELVESLAAICKEHYSAIENQLEDLERLALPQPHGRDNSLPTEKPQLDYDEILEDVHNPDLTITSVQVPSQARKPLLFDHRMIRTMFGRVMEQRNIQWTKDKLEIDQFSSFTDSTCGPTGQSQVDSAVKRNPESQAGPERSRPSVKSSWHGSSYPKSAPEGDEPRSE